MPIVRVETQEFHKQLGGEIKFEDLHKQLFQFGIEISIEEIFEEKEVEEKVKGKIQKKIVKTKLRDEYLIETAANRPDLTNLELIALAAGVFLGFRKTPTYKVVNKSQNREKIIVTSNVNQVRPYVVGAILRGVTFNESNFKSFIDLQDKLHFTFCRRRKLVAIGTHDYDTIKGPFTYDARAPKDINFIALKQTKSMNGEELMAMYEKDSHMKDFVPIIKNSPVYPVILDSNGVVCSLPPIINGEHSKITMNTKNIFIESTGTDYNRAIQNLNVIVGAFSYYCGEQFTFEEVEIEYQDRKEVTPKWEYREFETSLENIKRTGTVEVNQTQVVELLERMQHQVQVLENGNIKVLVQPFRSDIIHECDIIEDVCVAFGYNNIKPTLPQLFTVGRQQFLNKMSDLIREEMAFIGYKEGLNFALNNQEDLTLKLRKQQDNRIVSISNPRTQEFTCGRTTLIPGMLKWMQHNKQNELPLRLFEVGDVILKDKSTEIGAINQRRLCAVYTNTSAQFEIIHGVLDQIMAKLNIRSKNFSKNNKQKNFYEVKDQEDTIFFPKRGGVILVNDEPVGVLGILHPEINEFYDWPYPVSLFEVNIQRLIEIFDNY